jgi:large subunit ribosomal protein L1
MEIKEINTKIKELRETSVKRKFAQTFDLVFNLQNLDLKKPEHKVDVGVVLNTNVKPKNFKVCAIIDHTVSGAEEVFDKVLFNDELAALKGNMEKIRKITHEFDKFVVQANHMPLFAQVLGRYLGPMGKMPSPKLGMIITSKSPLGPLYEKLQKTVHLQTKKNLVLQVSVGSETESDEAIAENINLVYEQLIHALPAQKNNLKNTNLKLTMSKSVVL